MSDRFYPTTAIPLHPLMRLCIDVERSLHSSQKERTPMPIMVPVASSMFESIGHDPQTNELTIKFKNGRVYRHGGFTAEDHEKFTNAESMGKHYNATIRGRFPHVVVDEESTDGQSER